MKKTTLILLFLYLICPIAGIAQKLNIDDEIKLRVAMMEMIVERGKSNETTYKDAQYKVLNFLNFTDNQKKSLDTLFSNSWKKRLELFGKIKNTKDSKNINEFMKYIVEVENRFREQLTVSQLELYKKETQDAENQNEPGTKLLLRSMYFTDNQLANIAENLKK